MALTDGGLAHRRAEPCSRGIRNTSNPGPPWMGAPHFAVSSGWEMSCVGSSGRCFMLREFEMRPKWGVTTQGCSPTHRVVHRSESHLFSSDDSKLALPGPVVNTCRLRWRKVGNYGFWGARHLGSKILSPLVHRNHGRMPNLGRSGRSPQFSADRARSKPFWRMK